MYITAAGFIVAVIGFKIHVCITLELIIPSLTIIRKMYLFIYFVL